MITIDRLCLYLCLGLCCIVHIGNCLYFHIGETERKCFIEEIPDETLVVGNYKCQLFDPQTGGFMPSSPGIGMHVEVRDPDDKVVLSKGKYEPLLCINNLSNYQAY